MQITYQKENGYIFQRLRNTALPYKIGDTTSMGWKVLNIEYEYKSKYYSEYEYHSLIHKNVQKQKRKKQIKEKCIKRLITLLNYIIWLLIIDILRIIV